VRSGGSTVTRENGKRNLTIRIDNRDPDLTSYLKEAQAQIANKVHYDPDRCVSSGAASSRTKSAPNPMGQTLNVASGVGFIALFGVAVQNGIVMVANLNRIRKAGFDLHEAVMKGATERLRPVLMTATVATLGMLPAALHTGVGSDVQRGIATVVGGGLAVATVLTLFVLPSMYHVIEHWAEARHGRTVWHPTT